MPRFVQGVAVGHEDRGRRARFRLLVSRRRLVGTLALVLLAGVLTRYARDRPGQSVLIGHSIDRGGAPSAILGLVELVRGVMSVSTGAGAISPHTTQTRIPSTPGSNPLRHTPNSDP